MKLDVQQLSGWCSERLAGIASRLKGLPSAFKGLPARPQGLPVLSIGVVVVWLVGAAVIQIGWPGHLKHTRSEMERATSFAVSNPVVEVESRFLPVVRAVMPNFQNDELLGFLRKNQAAGEVAELQNHFDEVATSASELLEKHPTRRLGVVPAHLSLHGFATHVLVHASWLHLLATGLLFLLAAPVLEERWGRPMLAGVIVLLGPVGGGAFYAAHPTADRALVGGSAVVAGLVMAVVVALRDEEVDFLAWLSPIARVELIAPAWILAAVLALYEMALWWAIQGALPTGVDSAVGYSSHAAGAALGGAVALAAGKLGLQKEVAHAPQQGASRKSTRPQPLDLAKVEKLREQGDEDGAFALLEAEAGRSARNRNVVATFWKMAIARGEPDRAAAAMARLVQEELRRGAEDVAVDLWNELAKHAPSHLLAPQTLVQLAPAIGRTKGTECAIHALEQALDSSNRGFTAVVGMRVSQLALELDPELAGMAAHKALRGKGLDEKQRAELENLAAALAPDEPSLEARLAKKPSPSVFYEESDRSGFGGVVDDLSGPAEPEQAEQVLEQVELASPSDSPLESDRSGFGQVDDLGGPAEPAASEAMSPEVELETAFAEMIDEPESVDFGAIDDLGGPAEPAAAEPMIAEPETAEPMIAEPETAEPELEPAFAELVEEPESIDFGAIDDLGGPAEPAAAEPMIAEPETAEPELEPAFAELVEEPESIDFGAIDDLGGPAEPATDEPMTAEPMAAEPMSAEPIGSEPELEPAFAELVDEPDGAVFGEIDDLGGPAEPAAVEAMNAEPELEPAFAQLIDEPEDAVSDAPEVPSSSAQAGGDGQLQEPPFAELVEEPENEGFGEVGDLEDLDELSELGTSFPDGDVVEATPRAVETGGLRIEIAGVGASLVTWSRLRAVSLAGVHGLGPKPVVLIDLLVDGQGHERPLSVIRLYGNRFDPRTLVPNASGAIDALRSLLADLLARGDVRPLPDAAGAVANPVRVFDSLEIYHEQILRTAARDLA